MIHIIGNGGHAKVVREALAAHMGLFPIEHRPEGDFSFIAVGNNRDRKKESLQAPHPFVTIIHPSAVVSDSAKIGEGTIVMAGVVIQADAVIGRHCIINSCASVDHDCVLGDYVHIAPGAHLCGTVRVGEGAMVGTGVCIAQNTDIPEWKLVKAARLDIT